MRFPCFMSGLIIMSMASVMNPSIAAEKQIYEIRQFVVADENQGQAVDAYLNDALLPALKRAGVGPVGAYGPAANAESQDRFVVIPYSSMSEVPAVHAALDKDSEFLVALAKFESGGPKNAPYKRIASELLLAMDSMPQLKTAAEVGSVDQRVFELRVYESANEGLGDRKVEMFNSGEVPIFLDSGIVPVFLGQAVVGPFTPSLTYLTAYPSEEARQQAWKNFLAHPDWKVLSAEPKYQGTVSKIYKYVLRPLAANEL